MIKMNKAKINQLMEELFKIFIKIKTNIKSKIKTLTIKKMINWQG